MKSTIKFAGLALSLISVLASCSKEDSLNVEGKETYSIKLVSRIVRTTNDGLQTSWAEGDKVLVMHREHSASDALSDFAREDAEFVAASAGSETIIKGEITGTALEEGKSYDYLIYYPYKVNLKNIAAAPNAKQDIGMISQAQRGVSSKDGLCGANFPLYGRAEDVAFGAVPEISVGQQGAVAAICVTNASGAELNVFNITLGTSSTPLGGRYQIVFPEDPSEPVSFKEDAFDFNSNFIQLNVDKATIPAGGTGEFYIAVKPGVLPSGEVLTVGINGESHPITLTKDYTFRPGYIKPVSCTYRGTAEPKYVLVTEAPADWSGEYLFFVSNQKKKGIILDGSLGSNINSDTNSIDAVAEGLATVSEAAPLPDFIPYNEMTSKSSVLIRHKGEGLYSFRIKAGQYIGSTGSTDAVIDKGLNDAYINTIQFEGGVPTIKSSCGYTLRGRFLNSPTRIQFKYFNNGTTGQPVYLYRLKGTEMK